MITVNELRTKVMEQAWRTYKNNLGRFTIPFATCLKRAWASIKSGTNYMSKEAHAECLKREQAAKEEKARQEAVAIKAFEDNKVTSKTFTVAPWFAKKNMLLTSNNEVFTMVKETTKAMLLVLDGTSLQFWAPKSVCTACEEERPEYLRVLAM